MHQHASFLSPADANRPMPLPPPPQLSHPTPNSGIYADDRGIYRSNSNASRGTRRSERSGIYRAPATPSAPGVSTSGTAPIVLPDGELPWGFVPTTPIIPIPPPLAGGTHSPGMGSQGHSLSGRNRHPTNQRRPGASSYQSDSSSSSDDGNLNDRLSSISSSSTDTLTTPPARRHAFPGTMVYPTTPGPGGRGSAGARSNGPTPGLSTGGVAGVPLPPSPRNGGSERGGWANGSVGSASGNGGGWGPGW